MIKKKFLNLRLKSFDIVIRRRYKPIRAKQFELMYPTLFKFKINLSINENIINIMDNTFEYEKSL